MKIVSLDIHATKNSNVYDGRLHSFDITELRTYLKQLVAASENVVLILNAPMTGYVQEFETLGTFSPATTRGIEYFFSNRAYGYSTTKVGGVRVTNYSSLAYWTIIQHLFHINLSTNQHQQKFVPVFAREELAAGQVNMVETQSEVALWMLTDEKARWKLAGRKQTFEDFKTNFCRHVRMAFSGPTQSALLATSNTDQFNCVFSYAMCERWLAGDNRFGILGNTYTGSFLLPIDLSLLISFNFFIQHAFFNKLEGRPDGKRTRAMRRIAKDLLRDTEQRGARISRRQDEGEDTPQATPHAYDRAKERLGLNRKALSKKLPKVIQDGLSAEDALGTLKYYLLSKQRESGAAGGAIVYGENVYIFNDRMLVTVFRLPAGLHKYLSLSE
ncbi:MAG: hypothetical protein WA952_02015 [Lewinella sp.]